ncbi:MAG: branched-chain amino acid ABC transporter permease [Pseudomonadota bacterium]
MMREWQVNTALLAILAAFAGYAVLADEPFLITLATRIVIFAIAGIGLNLALGYGGLVSFGHAAFFGLGGYVCGILASHAQNYEPIFETPFLIEGTNQMLVIWPLAILVSALAALLIGALSLRTSGVYFIMITLAFAQMIFFFAISWPAYGGEDGLAIFVRNEFPGMDQFAPMGLFQVSVGVLAVVLLLVWRITGARLGMALQAARQNPGRVSTVGIRPFGVRLTAFTISAAITGWAGALYVDLNKFVSPAMISWETSGEIMIIVILGGVGRLFGPLAGAMLFILLEHYLGGVFEFWKILLGLALLAVVLFARGGVMGLLIRDSNGATHG